MDVESEMFSSNPICSGFEGFLASRRRWDQILLVPTYVNSSLDLAEFGGSSTNLAEETIICRAGPEPEVLIVHTPTYYPLTTIRPAQAHTTTYPTIPCSS